MLPSEDKAHLVGAQSPQRRIVPLVPLVLEDMRKLAHGAYDCLPAPRELHAAQLRRSPRQRRVILLGGCLVLLVLGWDHVVCNFLVHVLAPSDELRVLARLAPDEALGFGCLGAVEQSLSSGQPRRSTVR